MHRPTEDRIECQNKIKKEKEHALSTLCYANPRNPFYSAMCCIRQPLHDDRERDHGIEARKLKILALYFHHLPLTGESSLRLSRLTREKYDNFKYRPHHWSSMDRYF